MAKNDDEPSGFSVRPRPSLHARILLFLRLSRVSLSLSVPLLPETRHAIHLFSDGRRAAISNSHPQVVKDSIRRDREALFGATRQVS